MKIIINTDVLQRNNLSLGDFLVLLIGYYDVDYRQCCNKLVEEGIASSNLYNQSSIVLSDNSKDIVAKIVIDSDDKVIKSNIDFTRLANTLQCLYPQGVKPGTTYDWRGKTSVIEQKLKTLVAMHGFIFTEQEAIDATKEYLSSFTDKDKTHMQLLKYFILRTDKDGNVSSPFMTIIENNR